MSLSWEPGEGLNPRVSLQWSNDGGYTWSNEIWRELGKVGQHKRAIYWDRLGRSRDRVFKIAISDPCKIILVDAFVDADEGQN